jgi:hypothetical protein
MEGIRYVTCENSVFFKKSTAQNKIVPEPSFLDERYHWKRSYLKEVCYFYFSGCGSGAVRENPTSNNTITQVAVGE